MDRLVSMTSGLLTAGTETTSTTLSGTIFLILTHPQVHERLKEEIRSTFKKAEDINFSSVHRLPYMIAVISEAMRMYPAVSLGLPREVPDGGCMIAGHFVPERASTFHTHQPMLRD
jgi:cytochrome P450